MIELQNVSVHFSTQEVLTDVNLRINAGERIGIVGPNGAGKSTLFQLILGNLQPDSGTVSVDRSVAIGYARQHPEPSNADETLLEYSVQGVPRIHEVEERLRETERAVDRAVDGSEKNRLLKQLGELQTTFEHIGGYDLETRVKTALGGLGFPAKAFGDPFRTFSGGWRMRAELARILASKPDLLLLDEPSNYLDVPAVEWLQRFLHSFDGTLIIISHDRYLLRSLTRLTIEVDAGMVTRYAGDFDYYLRERDVRIASLVAAKANQDRKREHLERFIDRFKSQANKASQAQSRMKQLEKMEEIRLPKRTRSSGKMRLAPAPHCGAEVMRLEHVDFAYEGKEPTLKDVDLRINRGDRIGIIGFNGMGKTTLLRVLAGVRRPTAGTRVEGFKVAIGYQSQDFAETISPDITVLGLAKRLAPEWTERDLRTQLGSFGFTADDIDKQAGVLSGGEKIRLAFFDLFMSRPNVLLLDEPTTHLDLEGRVSLEKALADYDGTICFVSHDVEFVRAVATSILDITPEGVKRYPGTYDEYRAYQARKAAEVAGTDGRQGTQPVSPSAPEAHHTAGGPAMNSKELRRLKAQLRAKLQPRISPLKKRVEAAERKIEDLEHQEKELSERLASGAPDLDYATMTSNLRNIQLQLHRTALDWERDATELEKLQNELAEAQENL